MKLRLFLLISVGFLWLAAAPTARAWWLVDQFGGLTEFGPEGQVLGEGSGEDGSGEERKEESKRDEGKRDEFRTEVRPDENKAEMRFGDENRLKMESKPGEVKTEFRQGENRIKLERKDGEIRMKIKDEATGEERELKIRREEEEMRLREKIEFEKPGLERPEMEQELLRIREREDGNEIRVGSDNGRFVIKRNRVGAVSDFPLSVDLSTNTLSVTTPAGEKQVTILPDQAVQNMLTRNVIDRIDGQEAGDFSGRVRMSQSDDGSLIYEVEGEKRERLFGLVPMKFKKTAVVSAETGELLETKEALTNKILEFLSF